tara:strand:- start:127 stop:432 length:306 start_codon:yes stop_codon:yes gene_type:complete
MRKKNWIEFNNKEDQEILTRENDFIKSSKIVIYKEKKGKKGKVVTVISGFGQSKSTEFIKLLKDLKIFCGTGGTHNESQIQLQGDMQDKVKEFLRKDGYDI